MDDQLIGALGSGVFGVLSLTLGLNWYRSRRRLRRYGESAYGVLVGSKPNQYGTKYEVEFVTRAGTTHQAIALPKDVIEGRVEIVYDPDKPKRAVPIREVKVGGFDVLAWGFIFLGIVVLGMAIDLAT